MLRITMEQKVDSIALQLEGKLIGAWVDELRAVWSRVQSMGREHGVVLSLTEVSTIDGKGRHLLSEIHAAGGRLTGSGLFAKSLIEDISSI